MVRSPSFNKTKRNSLPDSFAPSYKSLGTRLEVSLINMKENPSSTKKNDTYVLNGKEYVLNGNEVTIKRQDKKNRTTLTWV